MQNSSYKSISEIRDVLIWVLRSINTKIINYDYTTHVSLHGLFDQFDDFCLAADTKAGGENSKLIIDTKNVGVGGRGVVSHLYENYNIEQGEKDLEVEYISYNSAGQWLYAYTDTVIKVHRYPGSKVEIKFNGREFQSPEFIHEAIVHSLAASLVTMSCTPHVVNIFGSYACKHDETQDTYQILEMADTSLLSIILAQLNQPNRLFELLSLENMIAWTIQVAWTAYVWKKHYNIVHADMHFGNLLLVDTQKPGYKLMYGAKDMRGIKWLSYAIGDSAVINIPVGRWLMKISDFGFSECSIAIGAPENGRKVSFGTLESFYGKDIFERHTELYNGVEVNYVIRMFCVWLRKLIDVNGYNMFVPVLQSYEWFAKFIDPTLNYTESLYNIYPRGYPLQNQRRDPFSPLLAIPGEGNMFIRYRGWGQPNQSIEQPLYNIMRALDAIGDKFVHKGKNDTTAIYTITGGRNFSGPPNANNSVLSKVDNAPSYVDRFMSEVSTYDACLAKKNHDIANGIHPPTDCSVALSNMRVATPNIFHEPSITYTTVMTTSRIVDRYGELMYDISFDDLEHFIIPDMDISLGLIYEMIFEPANMGYDFVEQFTYRPYHRNTLYSEPLNVGQPMEQVNLYFAVPRDKKPLIRVNENISLIQGQAIDRAWAMNGGFFIVPNNINNTLTPYLSANDRFKSIGYSFDGDNADNTLPIPLPYEADMMVIVQTRNDSIVAMRYSDFVDQHKLFPLDAVYQLMDGGKEYFALSQRSIATRDGKPLLDQDAEHYDMLRGYKRAFCTGPLLILNGAVHFTPEKMLLETMVLNETMVFQPPVGGERDIRNKFKLGNAPLIMDPYSVVGRNFRISSQQQTNSLYNNEVGEKLFPYGQRSASSLVTNAAMCYSKRLGQWFWAYAEGRGFYAPGVDKAQLAWLLEHFDVDIAINLDGGFSANIVYQSDKHKQRILMNYNTDFNRLMGSMFCTRSIMHM